MKLRILLFFGLLLGAVMAQGQISYPYVVSFSSAPTGTACGAAQLGVVASTQALYCCDAGVFAACSVSGGGPPSGTAGGSLFGSYPNPSVGFVGISGADVGSATAYQLDSLTTGSCTGLTHSTIPAGFTVVLIPPAHSNTAGTVTLEICGFGVADDIQSLGGTTLRGSALATNAPAILQWTGAVWYLQNDQTINGNLFYAPGSGTTPTAGYLLRMGLSNTVAGGSTLSDTGTETSPGTVSVPNTGVFEWLSGASAYFASGSTLNASQHVMSAPFECADTSGSATAQSCTVSSTSTPNLNTGDMILYTTTTQNTGDLTIAVNSGTARHVRKWLGAATLAAGDMPANTQVVLIYDGTYLEAMTIGNAPSGSGSPCTTTASSVQYDASGSFGCIPHATSDGTNLAVSQLNDLTHNTEVLAFTGNLSGVNYGTVANATTGNAPSIGCSGSDTNVGCKLTTKGTGTILPQAAVNWANASNPSLSTCAVTVAPTSSNDAYFTQCSSATTVITFGTPTQDMDMTVQVTAPSTQQTTYRDLTWSSVTGGAPSACPYNSDVLIAKFHFDEASGDWFSTGASCPAETNGIVATVSDPATINAPSGKLMPFASSTRNALCATDSSGTIHCGLPMDGSSNVNLPGSLNAPAAGGTTWEVSNESSTLPNAFVNRPCASITHASAATDQLTLTSTNQYFAGTCEILANQITSGKRFTLSLYFQVANTSTRPELQGRVDFCTASPSGSSCTGAVAAVAETGSSAYGLPSDTFASKAVLSCVGTDVAGSSKTIICVPGSSPGAGNSFMGQLDAIGTGIIAAVPTNGNLWLGIGAKDAVGSNSNTISLMALFVDWDR